MVKCEQNKIDKEESSVVIGRHRGHDEDMPVCCGHGDNMACERRYKRLEVGQSGTVLRGNSSCSIQPV
jgi:hypothetical protein